MAKNSAQIARGKKPSFTSMVIHSLDEIDGFTFRQMFGGVGLYGEGVFFGIIWEDQLFFRINSKTIKNYLKHDSAPLQFRERQKTNNYYEVPNSVMRNKSEFVKWAKDAIRHREK